MEKYTLLVAAVFGFFISREICILMFRFLTNKLHASYKVTSESLTEHGVYFGVLLQRIFKLGELFSNIVIVFLFLFGSQNIKVLVFSPALIAISTVILLLMLVANNKASFAKMSTYKHLANLR